MANKEIVLDEYSRDLWCPFCGVKIIDIKKGSTGVCNHLLFVSTDLADPEFVSETAAEALGDESDIHYSEAIEKVVSHCKPKMIIRMCDPHSECVVILDYEESYE